MKINTLSSISDKARGVIGRESLDEDEIFVFTGIDEGTSFHMQGVTFPISIAFLDQEFGILDITNMEPDTGKAKAPKKACYAVEACNDFYKSNKLKVGDFFKEVFNKISQKRL
jgi:uncharacterized membrane protein (UPF0127 family)